MSRKRKRSLLEDRQPWTKKEGMQKVLAMPEARAFVRDIFDLCKAHQSTVTPYKSFNDFNNGRRSIGDEVRQLIREHAPKWWLVMEREELEFYGVLEREGEAAQVADTGEEDESNA